MSKKEFFKERIDKIAKESFNADQKEIAKKIIDNSDEEDLDAVWGLVSQRVKTGFVFDEAPEINHNCVAYLKENEKLSFNLDNKDSIEHSLIIGENYDALKNLVATYTDKQGKGLIDVIYIDPPYNTDKSKEEGNDYKEDVEGKNKFIYRDKYTRDGWLNMMNERLKLAKKLLSDQGVILISIDDSEQAYLRVLCDDIFGENNFIAQFVWQKNFAPKNDNKYISFSHEYIIQYAKNKESFKRNLLPRTDKNNKGYLNPDNDSRGPWTSGTMLVTTFSQSGVYEIVSPTGIVHLPPDGRCWRYSKETLAELIKDNRVYWGKDGTGVPRVKRFLSEMPDGIVPQTLLKYEEVGSGQDGTQELKSIFGNSIVFDFPKPSKLIKRLIAISSNKNSMVLDFFAGSGTTAQAVMELNEEDGGNRKCILVTNNENNIAKNITRERVYRVINGKGSKGEEFDWCYSKDKKCLSNNSLRVFDIVKEELNLTDIDKAEKIKEEAEKNFEKLNKDYSKNTSLNIYNILASLTPYKEESED